MLISVEHRTRYRFEEDVSYSVHNLRLWPAPFAGQTVVDWRVDASPPCALVAGHDAFGNATRMAVSTTPHRGIEFVAAGVVDVEDRHGVVRGLDDPFPRDVFLRVTPLTESGPEIADVVASIAPADGIPWLHALMDAVRGRMEYTPGVTSAETTALDALRMGNGVCQDHAHVFIAAARLAGIPSRYVTGYLVVDGRAEADAHHAWAEAWVEGFGWIGFDVANATCPTDRYVRLAAALDARGAAPVRGARSGGKDASLEVEVRVGPVGQRQAASSGQTNSQ
jgi:transglutaminase-like putative cysteine protease